MFPTNCPESLQVLADYLEEQGDLHYKQVRQYYSQLKHNSEVKDWTKTKFWMGVAVRHSIKSLDKTLAKTTVRTRMTSVKRIKTSTKNRYFSR